MTTPNTVGPAANARHAALPLAGRLMELRDFVRLAPVHPGATSSGLATRAAEDPAQPPIAQAKLVFSAGASVRRYDYMRERYYNEVLVVEDGAIRLDRLNRGAPLLNSHNSRDLESVLGVVESPMVSNGLGTCDATFSRRESVAGYVQDVADGVIRNVSVGYARHAIQMVPPENEQALWTYRVIDWEPMEVSLVPIPADMDSQVMRSAGNSDPATGAVYADEAVRTFACEFFEAPAIEPAPVTRNQPRADAHLPKDPTMTEAELQAQREQEAAARNAAVQQAAAEASARAASIVDLCARHRLPQLATGLISGGKTVDEARTAILDELARSDTAAGGHLNVRVQTVTDETDTRMAGITEAITSRVDAKAKLTDNGRQYRGMSLMEIGRDMLESRGVNTRGLDRMQLATQVLTFRSPGMLTTSDFGSLLANVANKRLRNGYEENRPSYRMWARRAPNAPDFKTMTVAQLGAAPDLLQTNEHGEFTYGAMTDGKETYGVTTYGRIVSLSRQALINDDLRAFDRLITAFGNSAARLENRTVYGILTTNAAMNDTGALFNATAVTTAGGHANLTSGAPSALQASALVTSRAAMRKQKGLQSEELNIAPAFLIVPAELEQTAYQLTSSQYVPATTSTINEFRAGGRTALEPIVESILSANSATAWYLAADSASVDTVEYCYLDGAEGPVIESEMGFEVDGLSYKCRLDFAAKAIDWRGMHKSAGA